MDRVHALAAIPSKLALPPEVEEIDAQACALRCGCGGLWSVTKAFTCVCDCVCVAVCGYVCGRVWSVTNAFTCAWLCVAMCVCVCVCVCVRGSVCV